LSPDLVGPEVFAGTQPKQVAVFKRIVIPHEIPDLKELEVFLSIANAELMHWMLKIPCCS
jgi:hypothetical protein